MELLCTGLTLPAGMSSRNVLGFVIVVFAIFGAMD